MLKLISGGKRAKQNHEAHGSLAEHYTLPPYMACRGAYAKGLHCPVAICLLHALRLLAVGHISKGTDPPWRMSSTQTPHRPATLLARGPCGLEPRQPSPFQIRAAALAVGPLVVLTNV